MGYFPFFIDIKGRKCVIAGGGKVALRKIEKLTPYRPDITVIAPDICSGIEKIPGINICRRKFSAGDIDGAFMVIAASDNRQLNHMIYEICTERGILVNSVDDIENCGFVFPSLVKKGNISIGISTSGTAPAFAKFLRMSIEDMLDEAYIGIADILARYRPRIKKMFAAEQLRAEASEAIIDLCIADDELPSDDEIQYMLERIKTAHENKDRNKGQQTCAGSDGTDEAGNI